ncbi:MAG: hypothetical protein QXO75_04465 [Nitrososphaerota archaeon]
MPSTYRIGFFGDSLRALKENPDFLEEPRRIILTEELIFSLPRFEEQRAEFHALSEEEIAGILEDGMGGGVTLEQERGVATNTDPIVKGVLRSDERGS